MNKTVVELRKKLFRLLSQQEEWLKPGDGQVVVSAVYGDYFTNQPGPCYTVSVTASPLISGRRLEFHGKTPQEALLTFDRWLDAHTKI